MSKKNIILVVAISLTVIACILLVLVNVLGLNIIKHHDIQLGELTVKYYGNFSNVKIIKIYDGAIRRGTFELYVDNNIISNSNEFPPYLDDINEDGHEDIIIPHSFDSNNSVRYAVYIWNNEINMFAECEHMNDIANLTKDNENNYFSSVSHHKVIFEEQMNVPEVYESHKINTEYKIINEKICLIKNYTLIYYSETDAYCYIKNDYDPQTGELISSVEDWMSEKEASKIEFYKQIIK